MRVRRASRKSRHEKEKAATEMDERPFTRRRREGRDGDGRKAVHATATGRTRRRWTKGSSRDGDGKDATEMDERPFPRRRREGRDGDGRKAVHATPRRRREKGAKQEMKGEVAPSDGPGGAAFPSQGLGEPHRGRLTLDRRATHAPRRTTPTDTRPPPNAHRRAGVPPGPATPIHKKTAPRVSPRRRRMAHRTRAFTGANARRRCPSSRGTRYTAGAIPSRQTTDRGSRSH